MYKLVEEMRVRMKHLPVTVVGYGHMGDSNLHLNISAGWSCCLLVRGTQISAYLSVNAPINVSSRI